MELVLNPNSAEDYALFLKIKALPTYQIRGRLATFPDEYASMLGGRAGKTKGVKYDALPQLFDYQRDIAALALRKRKFAAFMDCGLGKTLVLLEWVKHVRQALSSKKRVLIISPLMVIQQTIDEAKRFYGDSLPIEQVKAADLQGWLDGNGGGIGITNYDAMRDDLRKGSLGAIACDESSMLKNFYGHWATKILELGEGMEWKLCLTGTPAPNDRIEYANHAVFLDQFPTQNAFLARFFINRGQTQERWEMKPHARVPFYKSLSHWSIFLSNPAVYGWKDNCQSLPPINTHIHHIELTGDQNDAIRKETGKMFVTDLGGITSRAKLAKIAKGRSGNKHIESRKPGFIADLIQSFGDKSAIIWCVQNDEQDHMASLFPDAANIDGSTPTEKRLELIADFKAGRRKVLLSKAKILGFGLNLQIATKQIFSGITDSYENYYQCIKRSNRYGSTDPLDVHIPVTDLEFPVVENVLRKAANVQEDTRFQEELFRANAIV